MSPFEVFDASILQDLQLGNWSEVPALKELLATSGATRTSDGHLVLWGELVDQASRTKVIESIDTAWTGPDRAIMSLTLHIYYREITYLGSHVRAERFTYTTQKIPEVIGNWEDQPPGYTVFTVVSNKPTLDLLADKFKSFISRPGPGAKSTLYVAASRGAIQTRFFCDEVRIEDIIDFDVAAELAIKEQRRSRIVLGLSYTDMVVSPSTEKPYAGKLILPTYPNVTPMRVVVEDKYGPFEKMWPQS